MGRRARPGVPPAPLPTRSAAQGTWQQAQGGRGGMFRGAARAPGAGSGPHFAEEVSDMSLDTAEPAHALFGLWRVYFPPSLRLVPATALEITSIPPGVWGVTSPCGGRDCSLFRRRNGCDQDGGGGAGRVRGPAAACGRRPERVRRAGRGAVGGLGAAQCGAAPPAKTSVLALGPRQERAAGRPRRQDQSVRCVGGAESSGRLLADEPNLWAGPVRRGEEPGRTRTGAAHAPRLLRAAAARAAASCSATDD